MRCAGISFFIYWGMRFSQLFEKCISMPYINVENAASFAVERQGSALNLYFEQSRGATDWKNNLDFPAKPYQDGGCPWFAHQGFIKVWKSAKGYVAEAIADPSVRSVTVVGYSHGAALAVFCHEYVWFHRPDLRQQLEGYGFGCPRVVWGMAPKERWERFTVIRNLDDLVTHLPPAALGYTHVGKLLKIGEKGRYSDVDAHRPENILAELKRYEQGVTVD